MKKIAVGFGKPVIGIVGCLHGNEKIGERLIESMKSIRLKNGTLFFILANEEAMRENKRCIESDLNRSFGFDKPRTHEEKLACSITEELKECDYVIDIHSTTADTDNFIIITKNDESVKHLAELIPLSKVVTMEKAVAKGHSLIDQVNNGVSIEFNVNTPDEAVRNVLITFLINLRVLDGSANRVVKEFYSVYGFVERKDHEELKLVNFEESTVDGNRIYPLFFGEKEYEKLNLICLKANKLKNE